MCQLVKSACTWHEFHRVGLRRRSLDKGHEFHLQNDTDLAKAQSPPPAEGNALAVQTSRTNTMMIYDVIDHEVL